MRIFSHAWVTRAEHSQTRCVPSNKETLDLTNNRVDKLLMLEDIGISIMLSENEISDHLSSIFQKLNFKCATLETIGDIQLVKNQVAFIVHQTDSEYPLRIEIYFPIHSETEEREQYIAKKLSDTLNCRTIVGYQEPNSIYPFSCLVFDKGKIFLANDRDTKFLEEGENLIKIIKEIKYDIDWNFDEYGKIIKRKDGTQ